MDEGKQGSCVDMQQREREKERERERERGGGGREGEIVKDSYSINDLYTDTLVILLSLY